MAIVLESGHDIIKTLSAVCVEQCRGRCCSPWWGIIFYSLRMNCCPLNMTRLKAQLLSGIKERRTRIKKRYVTREKKRRVLFKEPEKYLLEVENIHVERDTIIVKLRVMFAFRCLFVSEEGTCLIHPSMNQGIDVRPIHCDTLGSADSSPGEEGFCRVIDAAVNSSMDLAQICLAVNSEKDTSDRYYEKSYTEISFAVDHAIKQVELYCKNRGLDTITMEGINKTGRNEPCHCGSGRKYKRCHGRI